MKIPLPVFYTGGIVAVVLNNVILRSGGLGSFEPYRNTAAAICALVIIMSILALSGILMPKYFRPQFYDSATSRNKSLMRLSKQLDEIDISLKERVEMGREMKQAFAEIEKTLSSIKS